MAESPEEREESRPVLRAGALTLDRRRATVALGGVAVTLTRSEFLLLAALLERPGAVVPYSDLAGALWGERLVLAPWGRALALHAHRLRAKLRGAAAAAGVAAPAIEVVPSVGYRLRV